MCHVWGFLRFRGGLLPAAKVLASISLSVALTLPVRPSSNLTWVSMNCSWLAFAARRAAPVLLADEAAPDLCWCGELAVVGVELLNAAPGSG